MSAKILLEAARGDGREPRGRGRSGPARAGFLLAALVAAGPSAAGDGGDLGAGKGGNERAGLRLLVVQPGYPGTPRDAQPYMRRLAAHLSRRAALPGLVARYQNVPSEAVAKLRAEPAKFALVSLGFYLRYRRELHLAPRLEALPEERLWLVASAERAGSDPAALAGQSVIGGPLYEPRFLQRVAFAALAGVEGWKGVPTTRTSRALRGLARGRYAALVLTERELGALERGGRAKSLAKLRASEYYPTALFVIFGTSGSAEEIGGSGSRGASSESSTTDSDADRVVEALRRMQGDPEGGKILETLGCDGFRPVRSRWLEEVEKRYDAVTH